MVLNGDSTHPRPWRPPNDFERLFGIYEPYKIRRKYAEAKFQRKYNWIEDDSFASHMSTALKKGVPAGLIVSVIDLEMYSKLSSPRQKMLRVAYVATPIVAMFMSYTALRRLSSNMLGSMGMKRDSYWTYAAAAAGPSSILMAWHSEWIIALD